MVTKLASPLAAATMVSKFTRSGATNAPSPNPTRSTRNAAVAIRKLPTGPAAAISAARFG